MNIQESAILMLMLSRAYPTITVPDGTELLWESKFSDVEFKDVVIAVNEYIDYSPYWPSISEIREILRDQRDRRGVPYISLPPSEPKRAITRKEWTPEELESIREERRRVLDGLRNEGGEDGTVGSQRTDVDENDRSGIGIVQSDNS